VPPIYEYTHEAGNCAITGGVVYRGDDYPQLVSTYLYGDYCSGRVWGLQRDTGGTWSSTLLLEASQLGRSLTSFGTDEAGEIYVTDHVGGAIHRLLPDDQPTLESNHTGGAPGSFFTIRGRNFAPTSSLALLITEEPQQPQVAQVRVLGSVRSDAYGRFAALVNTEGATPGSYTLTVEGYPDTGITLTLDPDATTHPPGALEDATTFVLQQQTERLFLPLVAGGAP
jgi:hypothetical protein